MSIVRPITVNGISSAGDDDPIEDANFHGWRNKRSQTHLGTGTILHAKQRVTMTIRILLLVYKKRKIIAVCDICK